MSQKYARALLKNTKKIASDSLNPNFSCQNYSQKVVMNSLDKNLVDIEKLSI